MSLLMPFSRDIFSPNEEMLWPSFALGGAGRLEEMRPMPLDVVEKEEHYEIKADIPGVEKKDIHIHVDKGNVLRLSVESEKKKEEKKDTEGEKWHRYERSYGFVQRSLRMPDEADLAHVKAKYAENGVLELKVPKKAPEENGNRITIE